jgi:hypothetical protein
MKKIIILALSSVVLSGVAQAFSFADVTNWTGTGSNQAILVMDFNDGINPQSYAWGYRWDGTATGADMIAAIDAADSRLVTDRPDFGWGVFLNSAQYDANGDGAFEHVGAEYPSGWWSYWTAEGGNSWTEVSFGMSARTLVNGSWDGWSYVVGSNTETAPSDPVAAGAVPEPFSLGVLSLGVLALIARRKRV